MTGHPEHSVPCPAADCGAPAGQPCHAYGGSHPSRLDAWIAHGVNTAEASR